VLRRVAGRLTAGKPPTHAEAVATARDRFGIPDAKAMKALTPHRRALATHLLAAAVAAVRAQAAQRSAASRVAKIDAELQADGLAPSVRARLESWLATAKATQAKADVVWRDARTRQATAAHAWGAKVTKVFDPGEARDSQGQWTLTGAVLHALGALDDAGTQRHHGKAIDARSVGQWRVSAHPSGVLLSSREGVGVRRMHPDEARDLAAHMDQVATDATGDTVHATVPHGHRSGGNLDVALHPDEARGLERALEDMAGQVDDAQPHDEAPLRVHTPATAPMVSVSAAELDRLMAEWHPPSRRGRGLPAEHMGPFEEAKRLAGRANAAQTAEHYAQAASRIGAQHPGAARVYHDMAEQLRFRHHQPPPQVDRLVAGVESHGWLARQRRGVGAGGQRYATVEIANPVTRDQYEVTFWTDPATGRHSVDRPRAANSPPVADLAALLARVVDTGREGRPKPVVASTPPAAAGRPGWARRLLASLGIGHSNKALLADLIKAGPKGYEHGWRFVGAPVVGAQVHHPEHGSGTVKRSGKRTAAVRFASGHEASFEHGAEPPGGAERQPEHFVRRASMSASPTELAAPARKPRAPRKTALPAATKPVKAGRPKPLVGRQRASLAPKAPAEVDYTEPSGLKPGAQVTWAHTHEDSTVTTRTGRVWDAGPQGHTWVIPDERLPTDHYSAVAVRGKPGQPLESHDSASNPTGRLTAAASDAAARHRHGPPPTRFSRGDIESKMRELGAQLRTFAGGTDSDDPTLTRILTGFSPYVSAGGRLHPEDAARQLRESAALYRRNVAGMEGTDLGRYDNRMDSWRRMADVYEGLAGWFETEWRKRVESASSQGSANKAMSTGEYAMVLRAAEYVWKAQHAQLLTKATTDLAGRYVASARDRLAKTALAELVKVGPKGYEHGWVFVGVPGVGALLHHPSHGHGTVARVGAKTAAVRFESGHEAAFEHGALAAPGGPRHFTPRLAAQSKRPLSQAEVQGTVDAQVQHDRVNAPPLPVAKPAKAVPVKKPAKVAAPRKAEPKVSLAAQKRELDAEERVDREMGLYVNPRSPKLNTPYAAVQRLANANQREQVPDFLAGLNASELRQVARERGMDVRGVTTPEALRQRIAERSGLPFRGEPNDVFQARIAAERAALASPRKAAPVGPNAVIDRIQRLGSNDAAIAAELEPLSRPQLLEVADRLNIHTPYGSAAYARDRTELVRYLAEERAGGQRRQGVGPGDPLALEIPLPEPRSDFGRMRQERLAVQLAEPWRSAAPRKAAVPRAAKLSTDPAVRDIQVENRVRAAYSAILARDHRTPGLDRGSSEWVGMADLRDEIGPGVPREDVDAVLRRMTRGDAPAVRQDGFRLIPVANSKALTARDREAALRHSTGESLGAVAFADPSPRPLPTPTKVTRAPRAAKVPKPPTRTPAELEHIAYAIDGATTQQEAEALLADVRSADVRRIGRTLGVTFPAGMNAEESKAHVLRSVSVFGNAGFQYEGPASTPTVLTRTPAETVVAIKASTNRSEADAHLQGLTTSELRMVALHGNVTLPARGDKATFRSTIVDILVGGRLDTVAMRSDGPSSPFVPSASPAVAATTGRTPAEHASALQAMTTRDEASAYVASLRGAELTALARHYNVPSDANAAGKRNAIVDATVGVRLDSAAIRGVHTGRAQYEAGLAAAAATPRAPTDAQKLAVWDSFPPDVRDTWLRHGKGPEDVTARDVETALPPEVTVPPPSQVRAHLLGLPPEQRRDYLTGLGMTNAQANRLAKDLGARQTRINTDATIASIVGYFADAGTGADTQLQPGMPNHASVTLHFATGGHTELREFVPSHDATGPGVHHDGALVRGRRNASRSGQTGSYVYTVPDGVYSAKDRYGEKYLVVENGQVREVSYDEAVRGVRYVPPVPPPKGDAGQGPAALSGQPAEATVRSAYADLSRRPGDWVPLASLRDRLAHMDRRDVDKALESLAMQPGVQVVPWDNRLGLTARDHAAALRFGGEDNHALRIESVQGPVPNLTSRDLTTAVASPVERRAALLQQERAGKTVDVLPFFGGRGEGAALSQHWYRSFTMDGITYPTSEHYMMAAKARLFGDSDALARILATPDPVEAKRIGRQVRNFNPDQWDRAAYDVVVEANLAKFGQNPDLREYLLSTGDRVLVEASPRDVKWGIGRGKNDPAKLRPSQWRGENLLGFALMDVRERLRSASPPPTAPNLTSRQLQTAAVTRQAAVDKARTVADSAAEVHELIHHDASPRAMRERISSMTARRGLPDQVREQWLSAADNPDRLAAPTTKSAKSDARR
jgi:ribA/ribD-fused uncharacterized protein